MAEACGHWISCSMIVMMMSKAGSVCKQDYGHNDENTFHFNLKGEGVTLLGEAGKVGSGLIFDCEVKCDGEHEHCPPGETTVYERYGDCTTVNVDTKKGTVMLCTVETYFPTGSVIMEVRQLYGS